MKLRQALRLMGTLAVAGPQTISGQNNTSLAVQSSPIQAADLNRLSSATETIKINRESLLAQLNAINEKLETKLSIPYSSQGEYKKWAVIFADHHRGDPSVSKKDMDALQSNVVRISESLYAGPKKPSSKFLIEGPISPNEESYTNYRNYSGDKSIEYLVGQQELRPMHVLGIRSGQKFVASDDETLSRKDALLILIREFGMAGYKYEPHILRLVDIIIRTCLNEDETLNLDKLVGYNTEVRNLQKIMPNDLEVVALPLKSPKIEFLTLKAKNEKGVDFILEELRKNRILRDQATAGIINANTPSGGYSLTYRGSVHVDKRAAGYAGFIEILEKQDIGVIVVAPNAKVF